MNEHSKPDMSLPDGKTCSDCAFFKNPCEWMLSLKGDETKCDWYPIRFKTKQETGVQNAN